jgi:multidrug efflux system outer membrane protein
MSIHEITMPTIFPSPFASLRGLSVIALAAVATLSGCATVQPHAVSSAPELGIPTLWTAAPQDSQSTVGDAWWRDFGDPVLNSLIEVAHSANRDLHIAAARLAQARALTDSAEAERRPVVEAVASAQRGRENSAEQRVQRSGIGLRAAWELDLFGRGASMVTAAEADTESVHHAMQTARIALAADVATAYFELRSLEQRLALKDEAIEVAQRQVNVSVRKFEAGQVSRIDIERWQAELAQERASMVQLDGERRVRLHQLSLLLGHSQMPQLEVPMEAISPPPPPTPLLPAELLERRPDVLRQARAVDAALARAGVARRAVYPTLQIAWAGTQERLAAPGESAAPRLVVGYGVSLSLPILDSGRIRANVAVQDARAQEAMAEYEKAMLAAFVDVETSMAKWSTSGRTLDEWQRAESTGRVAARTAQRLYEAGNADLSAVLEARQLHLRARDAVVQAVGARWEAAVSLRRAFAGKI